MGQITAEEWVKIEAIKAPRPRTRVTKSRVLAVDAFPGEHQGRRHENEEGG
jgi:hypothetical protein